MKATMFIDKTDALLAGKNNYGKCEVEFSPEAMTEAERKELAISNFEVPAKINPENDLPYVFRSRLSDLCERQYRPVEPTAEELLATIRSQIELREKLEKETKAVVAEIHSEVAERIMRWIEEGPVKHVDKTYVYSRQCFEYKCDFGWVVYSNSYSVNDVKKIAEKLGFLDRFQDAIEEAKALAFWQNAEETIIQIRSEKRRAEEETRKKAEEAAIEERKRQNANQAAAQIAAWVEAHGDENMKGRLRDGLLPTDEVLDAIREEAYSCLAEFPRYTRLKKTDVCGDNDEYGDHDPEYSVDYADSLTAAEYDTLMKIKAAAPKTATIEPRVHTGTCPSCETSVSRKGFMVRITVGEFEFSREYAADGVVRSSGS